MNLIAVAEESPRIPRLKRLAYEFHHKHELEAKKKEHFEPKKCD